MTKLNQRVLYFFIGFIFLSGAVASIYGFINSFQRLMVAFENHESVIILEKGRYYLLGVGLGLSCGVFGAFYEKVMNINPSQKIINIVGVFLFSSFVLMLVMPQVIGYFAESRLEERGYRYCSELSRAWLINKDIAYVKDESLCVVGDKTP